MRVHKKIGLALGLALVWCSGAFAQTATVTGNLVDLGLNNATQQNTYVIFTLQNYGSNIPRILGSNIIVSQNSPQFKPNGSGIISGTIIENSAINPTTTFYRVCIFYQGTQFQCNNFLITANFNLNTATPLAMTPTAPLSVAATILASGTAALGTNPILSGACAPVVTITASGVLNTDNVLADFNGDPTGTVGYMPGTMLTIVKYPSAGAVNFKVCNNTANSITPAAITINWRVPRP